MKKTSGMREILAMKAQARTVLERLIPVLRTHAAQGMHFKGTHTTEADRVHDQFMRFVFSKEQLQTIVRLAYSILERIAHDKPVTDEDLDALTTFLDNAKGKLRFYPNHARPYHRVHPDARVRDKNSGQAVEVAFAENLLDYMNLCALYGREHEICSQCGALMISGRGAKKFCSIECRKAYWSYSRQKDYYTKKRKQRSAQ